MSQITTHVLDTALGKPARGIRLSLSQWQANTWLELASGTTNSDGRLANLLAADKVLEAGTYRMYFALEEYLIAHHQAVFYPYAEIVFRVEAGGAHYHIPLLLSPFGYSTYRGS